MDAVIKRLDAHRVAREHQLPFLRVPQGECEDAVKALEAFNPPFCICGKNHFRIGSALEWISLKLGA